MHHKFHDDLDVYTVFLTIISKLEEILQNKESILQEYRRLQIIVERSQNPIDKAKALELLHQKDKSIQFIKDGTLVSQYKKDVKPILDTYNSLSSSSCIFGVDTCNNVPKRVHIILQFLEVSSFYIEITWECTFNISKLCPKCYGTLRKKSTIMRCDSCQYSFTIVPIPTIQMSGNHIKVESTYQAKKNFIKEYKHVCGILHSVTPEQKKDTEDYIYKIQEQNPTRETIRNAIKQCGYNNYNDTNYLFHIITGVPLPPIDGYLDTCANKFDEYYYVFTNIEKEGKNITNIHFLIRLFLRQEGVKYEDDWFSTLSDSTQGKHRRNARKICAILQEQHPEQNWSFPDDWKE